MNRSALRSCSRLFVVGLVLLAACHAEPDDQAPPGKGGPVKKAANAAVPACTANEDPALKEPFRDGFDRTELGDDWRSTSYGAYYLKNGKLCTSKPRNHPLWLKRRLPTNVRVEFEAQPASANGDVKGEIFGDGCSFDTAGRDYTSTGYVGVLGAHNNSEHWLARLFEHGTDAKKTSLVGGPNIASSKLVVNTTYHVELSRTDGHTIQFLVDGVTVQTLDDAAPLQGTGHDHFAFDGWEPPVCFDNLVVTPL